MTEHELRRKEIRNLAKNLVLQFMQSNPDCEVDKEGLRLAKIFRMCGFDWGKHKNATSSNQQCWVVALARELEKEGKIHRTQETKRWKLRENITKEPQATSVLQESTESVRQTPVVVNNQRCLPITLEPSEPNIFKQELLRTKKAIITTFFSDGKFDDKTWHADKFSASSNVWGNLRSRHQYRSVNWQTLGIEKVHVKVVEHTSQSHIH